MTISAPFPLVLLGHGFRKRCSAAQSAQFLYKSFIVSSDTSLIISSGNSKQRPNEIGLRDLKFEYTESIAHKVMVQFDCSQTVKCSTLPSTAFKMISQISNDHENNYLIFIMFIIAQL